MTESCHEKFVVIMAELRKHLIAMLRIMFLTSVKVIEFLLSVVRVIFVEDISKQSCTEGYFPGWGRHRGIILAALGSGTINAITYILKHLGLRGHTHSIIYESLGFLVRKSSLGRVVSI